MNIQVRLMAQQALAQMAALRAGTGTVSTGLNAAGVAATGFGAKMAAANLVKWGSQMQWIGRQIEYNFTLPLVAAGAFATKWAMENERAFTRLSKVYGDNDLQAALGTDGINNELQALQRNLVALSNLFGIAQADAINIAADWAAAGSSGVALARATKLTMQAMVLGELEAKEATEALIAIQSQFAFSTEDLAKTLNQLNMVENQTGVSMGGLIQAFARAAGVARSAGIDTLHLAAMIAAMTPAAGSAAQAGNALKTIISRLLSPTKEATEVLGLMGIRMTDMGWKSANAGQRLEILAKNFHSLSDGQKAVVSAVVASRYQINKFDVLMEAIINKQSFYHKALESAADADANAAQAARELNAVLDSNPKKMDQIVNIMKNASAEVGQQLIPAFLMAANAVRLALQWFNNLDPSLQKFIITTLIIAAVIGPVIRYIAVMATSIGLLGKMAMWSIGALAGAARAIFGFGAAQTVVTATTAATRAIIVQTGALVLFQGTARVAGGAAVGLAAALKRLAGAFLASAFMSKVASGAFIALVGTARAVQTGLLFMQRSFMVFWGVVAAGGAMFWGTLAKLWTMGMFRLQMLTLAGSRQLGRIWRAMHFMLAALDTVFLHGMRRIWMAGMLGLQMIVIRSAAALGAAFRVTGAVMMSSTVGMWAGMVAISKAWGRVFVTAFRATMFALQYTMIATSAALGRIWRAGLGVLAATSYAFMSAMKGFAALWRAFWVGLAVVIGTTGRLAVVAWTTTQVAFMTIMSAGHQAMLALQAAFQRAWLVLQAAWGAATTRLWAVITRGWIAIQAAGSKAMLALFSNFGRLALVALTSPWGIILGAIAAFFLVFYNDIKATWQMVINFFKTGTVQVGGSVSWLANLWAKAIQAIINAFGALPKGVQSALMSVVNMVRSAAMAVYRLFSYINPFARHSPSLVENVQMGMAVVKQEFAGMATSVGNSVKAAYARISAFGRATAGLLAAANAAEMKETQETFTKAGFGGVFAEYQAMNAALQQLKGELAGAKAAVEAQEAVVDEWKTQLDAANAALDEQQKILDGLTKTAGETSDALNAAKEALQGFIDTPIEGELALTDAIRQNQLEQKKLQLEMLKMEQAGESLDDIKTKYNQINGMIEQLRGEQASLREAGAGSEILGVFDAQIAALEGQRDALEQNQGPLSEMSKALDELKLKGEMMDLEKAINFDALHDQIEMASKSMTEMPFDQIMANVIATKATVDQLTAAHKTQEAAVKAQEAVVEQYKAARDAIQASYDAENKKLDQLRDAYQKIQQAVSDMETAMNDAKSAADALVQALEKAKNAKDKGMSPGAQNFLDAAGADFPNVGGTGAIGREGGLGDQSSLIDEMTKDLEKQLNDSLASLNPFNWIKKKWEDLKKWWSSTAAPGIKDFFSNLNVGGDSNGEGGIFGVFEKAKDAGKKFLDIMKEVWGWLEPKIEGLGKTFIPIFREFGGQLKDWADKVKELKGPLMEFWDMIEGAMPIIKFFAYLVGGVLLGAFAGFGAMLSMLIGGALGFIGPMINGIVNIIKGVIQTITGIMNIFVGLFTGDWERMGEGVKQIVSGLWNTIKGLFQSTIGAIFGLVKGMVSGIIDFFLNLWDVLVGHSIVPDMVTAIIKWMTDMPGKILGAIAGFVASVISWAASAFGGMVNKAIELAKSLLSWLGGFPSSILKSIASLGTDLLNAGKQHFNQFITSVKAKAEEAKNFAKTIPGLVSNALGSLGNTLYNKGKELIQGLINGIKSMIGSVGNAMSDIASKIKGFLPGSPVKEGPMSGRGELKFAGQKLMTNLAGGIEMGRSQVDSAMVSVSSTVRDAFGMIGSDTVKAAGAFVSTSAAALQTAANAQAAGLLSNQAKLSTIALQSEAGVINTGNTTVININGDLVLPNISSGADADTFVKNLEALASGGRG